MRNFTSSINRNNYKFTLNTEEEEKEEGLYFKTSLNERLITLNNDTPTDFMGNLMNIRDECKAYGDLKFFTAEPYTKASKFFEEIMYKVDLDKLYNIIDTCYYAQRMPYCPILVENMQAKQESYLLQVWNKEGEIHYEKELKKRPIGWCVTNQFLVFKPAKEDQISPDEDCYYIVFLYKDNITIRINVKGIPEIENIESPIIGFCNLCLYISHQNKIYILNINGLDYRHTENVFVTKERAIKQISLGKAKNHAFVIHQNTAESVLKKYKCDQQFLIICCETSDNQIDFARLIYEPDTMKYKIEQISEVVKRQRTEKDPIQKFMIVYDNSKEQWPYAISLKESGSVDFYWNYYLIENEIQTPKSKALRFEDIELDFDAFYLKSKSRFGNDQCIYRVALDANGRIGLDDATKIGSNTNKCVQFEQLFQHRLTTHVNFYTCFCMVATSFMVAHGNKIFVYDIQTKEIIKQFQCQDKVAKFFRTELSDGVYEITVILKNGTILQIKNKDNHSLDSKSWELNTEKTLKLSGCPKQMICNHEHQKTMLFLSQQGQESFLQSMNKGVLHNFEPQWQRNLTEQTIILPVYAPNQDNLFAIYNPNHNPQTGKLQIIKHQMVGQRMQTLNERNIIFQNTDIKNDHLHAVLAQDLDDTVFLFGKRNMYKIQVTEQVTEVVRGTNIVSLQLLDNNNCYAIVQRRNSQNTVKDSGAKIFSLKTLVEKKELQFFDIEPTVVARNSSMGFSQDNQRVIYLKNYETVHIIPPLHRSTISFIGMLPRERYLAVKKSNNRFHALDKKNRITTWNALTGKLIEINNVRGVDYSNYTLFGFEREKQKDYTYAREWYQPNSLIMSNQDAEEGINTAFLDKLDPLNDIEGCIGYINQPNNQICFRNFKVIEIQDEFSVTEHFDFVHQFYRNRNKIQRLNISHNRLVMIEKLENLKILAYQKTYNEANNKFEWDLQKRFYDFPHELSDKSQCLFLFSPDFEKYLNYDISSKSFVIKYTFYNQNEKGEIQQDLQIPVAYNIQCEDDIHDAVKRFRWVDDNRFLMTSKWGFEKMFEIKNEQIVEISSSQIPAFFELKDLPQIYFEESSLAIGDVQRRLLRKHQALKRLRFICDKEEHSMIYEALFSVDYNIDNCAGKFVSDLSFSYMQWKLIEELEDDNINARQIDEDLLKQLCLNILPGCKTILHYLTKQTQELTYILSSVPVSSLDFEMPFIKDLKGMTPLHYCLNKGDFKTADLFINYLSNAPLDHHSRQIIDILPELVNKDLPSLLTYFDRRMLQTEQIKAINRGSIQRFSSSVEVGMMSASIWDDPKNIRTQLFEIQHGPVQIDAEVELKFIDLPEYHLLGSQYCIQFLNALKDTDNLKIFELKSIRLLIEYLWPIARKQTRNWLFFPFIGFLFSFWLYTNFIDELSEIEAFQIRYVPWLMNLVILILFSVYFLENEVRQIMDQKGEYFKEPWNYIDLIPPIIIFIIAIINFIGINTDWESALKSLGSLLMWLKLLYFCRIYKSTGYLIRMIVKVVFGMRVFLLVLLITILAVADAFVSIQKVERSNEFSLGQFIYDRFDRFLSSVYITYRMILGGDSVEVEDEFNMLSALLIVFCTLFVMIVMLNLLISIISDAFGKVQENQVNEYYQEKVSIIAENIYLIPEEERVQPSQNPGHLLLTGAKAGFIMQTEEDVTQNDKDKQQREELVSQIKNYFEKKFETIEKMEQEGNNNLLPSSTSRITQMQ